MNESPRDARHGMLAALVRRGAGVEEALDVTRAIRAGSRDGDETVDRLLLEEVARLRGDLEEARRLQREVRAVVDRLTADPWHSAVYLRSVETERGPRAVVGHRGSRIVVALAEGVEAEFRAGEEVFLNSGLNAILARSPAGAAGHGETAFFDRRLEDGRLVLRRRDEEELVVDAGDALLGAALRPGDLVRVNPVLGIALERLERPRGGHAFLEELPREGFELIGGLDRQIREIQRAVRMLVRKPELAAKYGVRPRRSVLLVGPPGTGKTMMARALASWLGTLSPSGRARFMHIPPMGLHSSFYAQSEANYRETFRMAREAAREEPDVPVTLFFDEVDAVGMTRGNRNAHIDDRVLTAFMSELDGLEDRGSLLVVAATNRRDALDPALLRPGRLGDLVIPVPRPDMAAAREIFKKYLRPEFPYAANGRGGDPAAEREAIIESALSRLYSPNGESELAAITFRDGSRRVVRAADLASGALIARAAGGAAERAMDREAATGEPGIRREDLLDAVAEEFSAAAAALSPRSCRDHLQDLPSDLEVVRVEPVERRVPRPHRYLNTA